MDCIVFLLSLKGWNEPTQPNTTTMTNAIEFKNNLVVTKIRKSTDTYNEYEFDINEKTYYIYKHRNNTWSSYCEVDQEFYAYNTTRKSVVADIISGLWIEYKNNNI